MGLAQVGKYDADMRACAETDADEGEGDDGVDDADWARVLIASRVGVEEGERWDRYNSAHVDTLGGVIDCRIADEVPDVVDCGTESPMAMKIVGRDM